MNATIRSVPVEELAPPSRAATNGLDLVALKPAPARDLCTDCGLSRTQLADRCGQACQFIRPRYEALEQRVHGRKADLRKPDEVHFGPIDEMLRARLVRPRAGAQWSGITTRIAERLLETGQVDAVLATASDPDDRWAPRPVIVTRAADMAQCRGMKMGFSPLLGLLDRVREAGYRRIAVVGVSCQIHALRAIEAELGLEALYVLGTPCSDNTKTEHFHRFLGLLTQRPEDVTYLEFMPDYQVELRFQDGRVERIPFLSLPISSLPDDFFPLTCRSCMDYTNRLADLTVGYLAGDGDQWLIARNDRGRALLALVEDELVRTPLSSSGRRAGPVAGFQSNLDRRASGLPVRRAPRMLRPLIHRMQRSFGPRGLEFARARIEMRILEGIDALRRERPRRVRNLVPRFAWAIAAPYGLSPRANENDVDVRRR
jgi:coenzyme F420 hydrogenase subunit beta